MPKKLTAPLSEPITRRTFFQRIGGFIASHWLLTSIPLAGAGVFGWAGHDTLTLTRQYFDLFYPNLPDALEGKTICQLSDLHLESLRIPPEHLREDVMAQKPDLIVITGDIISSRTDLDKLNPYLSGLTAPYGKFVVMGNNDYSHLSRTLFKRYLQQYKTLGWTHLLNEASYLPDLNLWIIGVDDPATAHDDVDLAYQTLPSSPMTQSNPPFRLVLAHSTDCLDDVAKYGAELFLTGHTHGGQIRLPGFKPLITNTYLGDLGFYEGYHVINGVPLYINPGIGESLIPLRLNVPPEITFFTLHRGDAPPRQQKN
ncbi:metallophosphoesterase [Desulfosporosinus sp. BICA1-9]|uniref:metallophosphoesterase n=1 Tax=Desulfosporosinus sp. BICA1-9 TaxID=1531958 RepID=UPI00054C2D89|nr:metallophosphoesterase [Desulfosporosinus sp. BICA1-9]KJS47805.1 MAG: phosphoesterase [Peptococcaceae bacterium BRH_c23]KJS89912.1 MAG: phosphoesterase [Desulfosporosinus sp. BICA1-9]HBW35086.1 phosphoesterase [Desulfosporosinus sp.]